MIKLKNGKFYIRDAETLEEFGWFNPHTIEFTYTQEESKYDFPICTRDCSISYTATVTGGTLYDWMMDIVDMHERHRKEVGEIKNNIYKPRSIKWCVLYG